MSKFSSGISYASSDGFSVKVEPRINPYQILNITTSTPWSEIRGIFRTLINTPDRQKRVLVTLAYPIVATVVFKSTLPDYFQKLSDTSFTYDSDHPVVMALTGQCEALRQSIEKDRSICDIKSPQNESLLYLAVRSGYLDVVEMLCVNGVNINAIENGSTALHAATYYNHEPLVSFLIESGASINQKNMYGNIPIDEAFTDSMKQLITNAKSDPLVKLLQDIQEEPLVLKLEHIYYKNEIVAYRIQRKVKDRKEYVNNWIRGFHGTKSDCVVSIFKNGLLMPGDKLEGSEIQIRSGHIKRGVTVNGILDWGRGIFLSTSVYYASHNAYTEKIISPKSGKWCLSVEVGVRPNSYTTFRSTTPAFKAVPGEIDQLEVRVVSERETIVKDSSDLPIFAEVSPNTNSVVLAVILVKESFLATTIDECLKTEDDPSGTKLKFMARAAKVLLAGASEPRTPPNSILPKKEGST